MNIDHDITVAYYSTFNPKSQMMISKLINLKKRVVVAMI